MVFLVIPVLAKNNKNTNYSNKNPRPCKNTYYNIWSYWLSPPTAIPAHVFFSFKYHSSCHVLLLRLAADLTVFRPAASACVTLETTSR